MGLPLDRTLPQLQEHHSVRLNLAVLEDLPDHSYLPGPADQWFLEGLPFPVAHSVQSSLDHPWDP